MPEGVASLAATAATAFAAAATTPDPPDDDGFAAPGAGFEYVRLKPDATEEDPTGDGATEAGLPDTAEPGLPVATGSGLPGATEPGLAGGRFAVPAIRSSIATS